jgi:hypothetical protein
MAARFRKIDAEAANQAAPMAVSAPAACAYAQMHNPRSIKSSNVSDTASRQCMSITTMRFLIFSQNRSRIGLKSL